MQQELIIHKDKLLSDWNEWTIDDPEVFYITTTKTMDLRFFYGSLQQKHVFRRYQPENLFDSSTHNRKVICVEEWTKWIDVDCIGE